MLKLVIFDCDGVLVDSEPIANAVLAKHLSELGAPHTIDDCYRHYRGLSMPAVVEKIQSLFPIMLPQDFLGKLQQETFAAFAQQLRPIPGVVPVLNDLREKAVPFCVASSGSHDKLAHTLTTTGLMAHFQGRIFSADDVKEGKPAPDLFLHAAARMDIAPRYCLVLEDSLPGLLAALAAQMQAVAYCPPEGNFSSSIKEAAHRLNCRTIRHLSELIDVAELTRS